MVPACMFIYPHTDTHAYTYLKIKTTYKENPERNMAFEVLIILQLAYKVMGFFLTFFFFFWLDETGSHQNDVILPVYLRMILLSPISVS